RSRGGSITGRGRRHRRYQLAWLDHLAAGARNLKLRRLTPSRCKSSLLANSSRVCPPSTGTPCAATRIEPGRSPRIRYSPRGDRKGGVVLGYRLMNWVTVVKRRIGDAMQW